MRQRSFLGILVLLVILLTFTSLQFPISNKIKGELIDGFVPFAEFLTRIRASGSLLTSRFKAYAELQEENTELRKKVAELSTRVAQVSELERENREYSTMLEFKKQSELRLIPAKVVSRDSSNWWNTFQVDRGSEDGIRTGMPVLTVDGLVGKTIEVTGANARVLLITDENCRISGLLNESRLWGIVEGNALEGKASAQCRMTFVNRTGEIKNGEKVFTSGMGEVFPKGILIGTVQVTRPKTGSGQISLYQEANVTPAVDLRGIEEVFIGAGLKSSAEMRSKPQTQIK